MAASNPSRLSATAPERRQAFLAVRLAGLINAGLINTAEINSTAINTATVHSVAIDVDADTPHRAKGFGRHQDAMVVEILDLDTASPVERVRLFGAKSRIHGRMAVQVQSGHTAQGTTTAAPDKSRMKSKDTPWKGTTP